MKEQKTVDAHFSQIISDWEEARAKKIQNIGRSRQAIREKIQKLQNEDARLLSELQRIDQEVAPRAPSAQERKVQREKSINRMKLG